MTARLWLRWMLLALAFSLAVPLAAQQQTGNLGGVLRVSRGSFPTHRVEVTLYSRGMPVGTTYADNEGRFGFSGLPPNLYHITINDPDYRPVDQTFAIDPVAMLNVVVNITLMPLETAPPKQESVRHGANPNLVNPSEYLKNYPKGAVKEYEKGLQADKNGKVDDAIRHYEKAVKEAPDFYRARNNLGAAYLGKSNFPAAQEQFQTAIKLNNADGDAYFNLGNAYLLTNRPEDALRTVQDGLRREPDSAFGQFMLGAVLDRSGHTADAESAFQRALQIEPTLAKCHLALVNIYLREKRTAQAVQQLNLFLKEAPADPFAPKARQVLKRLESSGSPQ